MWWSDSMGKIELNVDIDLAKTCSHPGDCESDVRILMQNPAIKDQLENVDPDTLRDTLTEYGAWNVDELQDHGMNLVRILWVACCDLVEEYENEQFTEQ
jgi:hypothetical protein